MNRQQRRAAAKTAKKQPVTEVDTLQTSGWDELRGVAHECANMNLSSGEVIPLLRNSELSAKIEDLGEFRKELEVFNKDVAQFTAELQEIQALHKGKTGGFNGSDEDMVDCFQIFERYHQWLDRYQAVMLPQISKILATYHQASLALEQEKQNSVNEEEKTS